MFDDVTTYNGPLDASTVSGIYNAFSIVYFGTR